MTSLKLRALAGVSALMAVSALGAAANASTISGTVNGGGSTLLAPYWMQGAYCYDTQPVVTIPPTAPTAGVPNNDYWTKGAPTVTGTAVTATTASGCGVNTGTFINYDATGSGAGQAGVLAHAAVISDPIQGVLFGSLASGAAVYSSIQYGLSDNALVNTDLATYDVGTGNSETLSFNGNSGAATAPSTYQGLTFSTAAPSATNFPISKPLYGPLVQIPASIDPVALSYNPVIAGRTVFNIQAASKNANGGLALDASAYCKIFTGAITNWNDAALTALNAGVSLTGGASVPIKLIGRSDSSGTTSIFTRHLAAVCTGLVTTNPYTAGVTTLPTAVASLYTTASGSAGVANAIDTTVGAIGYIGADYVLPAVTSTHAVTFSLPVAALKNNAGNFEEPNASTAGASFGAILPPQSTSTGAFNSADTTTDRRDPTQWTQTTAATAPLANPSSTIATAYPIVGTTNFIGYTCYASANSVNALEGFLNFGAGATAGTILNNASLGQLPAAWINAIGNTFFSSTGDAHSLNLFLATAGTGSANSKCSASGVVGG